MHHDTAERLRTTALILAGFALGLAVPDLDQLLPLAHRSALTHSVLPAVIALLHPERGRLAAGLALGIGTHLAADSFPNAMTGYATVKLPLAGSLGATGSYVWLGANALAALLIGAALAGRILPRRWALVVLAAVGLGSLAYLVVTDGGWPVLALGGAAGALGWRFRRQ